ncbi:MAG: gephyrin-like molybdotransferase Glp [Peptococcaceae bacterium]|nr:gephyrin-like molybdotransferase Glp [Peptococcaceae bacterium]
MLEVKTPQEVISLINTEFTVLSDQVEIVSLDRAIGRVLAEDVIAKEYVPDFNRSTVDGYAVRARDTFGCTDAIPAILPLAGEIFMGEGAGLPLQPETCVAVPTGGAVPEGADSVVMVEYTDNYGDGTIGVTKPVAPGQNLIFRGDDVYPGKIILKAGRVLSAQDIGALAAIGQVNIRVSKKICVGIISTGDELVPPENMPGPGQIRDVNSVMLQSMLQVQGVQVKQYGIVIDDAKQLASKVDQALEECDVVVLSGGSSVGVKDVTCQIIEERGTLLFHGIAIKPGKPTIFGKNGNQPLIGLPGHPVAAYFITKLFVLPLLGRLMGREMKNYTVTAHLSENVSANHGRAQYQSCHLEADGEGWIAHPVRGKSGLITALAGSDGYFCIDRDCEGLPQGAEIQVTICSGD